MSVDNATNPALAQVEFVTSAAHAGGGDAHGGHHPKVAHQFDDLAQQHEASTIGMWAFLGTEIMFFGGALTAYAIYRHTYPEAFAKASSYENWLVGAINTGVLLCSSLTMAFAVHSAQVGAGKWTRNWLLLTILFALGFLGIKAFEYTHLIHEGLVPGTGFDPTGSLFSDELRRPAQLFYSLYFAMTGLHALHMIIGIGVILVIAHRANRGDYTPDYHNPVEMTGLYWHFVDIVWIFLYPLLYLVAR